MGGILTHFLSGEDHHVRDKLHTVEKAGEIVPATLAKIRFDRN